MLDTTTPWIVKVPLQPAPKPRITGHYLARNRLPLEAKVALALRVARDGEPVSEFTVGQIARLCRVPRAKLDQHLGRHRNVGDALVRAFRRASLEQWIAFVRAIGSDAIWAALSAAL